MTCAPSIEEVLGRNLRFLRWLGARVAESTTPARRAQFTRELARALLARLDAVEEHVVPGLLACGLGEGLAADLQPGEAVRSALGAAATCDPGDASALERHARAVRGVLDRVEEEYALLEPLLQHLLPRPAALALGAACASAFSAWPATDSQWGALDDRAGAPRSAPMDLDE
ncbi:MAG TPA: hypothetical protein VFX50_13210 [Gemmatimonadales bacterium]|nr:hypothetical protein [Gemmatimonadales bacterium]